MKPAVGLGIAAVWALLATGVSCERTTKRHETPRDPDPVASTAPTPEPASTPAPTPSATPDAPRFGLTVDPTLESIQTNLLDVYCVRCHQGDDPPRKLSLTNLSQFVPPNHVHDPNGYHGTLVAPGRPGDSMLYIVMSSPRAAQQMPPPTSGLPLVTEAQLQAVAAWITALDDGGSTDEPGDSDGVADEPGVDDGTDGSGDEP